MVLAKNRATSGNSTKMTIMVTWAARKGTTPLKTVPMGTSFATPEITNTLMPHRRGDLPHLHHDDGDHAETRWGRTPKAWMVGKMMGMVSMIMGMMFIIMPRAR